MREYSTDAIILGCDDSNGADARIDFYTRDFGRLRAKAVSAKKITSKLAGHLQPLTLSRIRLVEKSGFIVTDALMEDCFEGLRNDPQKFSAALKLLAFFREHVFDGEPDADLWHWLKNSLKRGLFSYEGLQHHFGLETESPAELEIRLPPGDVPKGQI